MNGQHSLNELLKQLPATTEKEQDWLQQMATALNHLVLHDFNSLVQVLYRVDVSEQTAKQLLQQHPEKDAGLLLARLLLERQQQKAQARSRFTNNRPSIADDEDRW